MRTVTTRRSRLLPPHSSQSSATSGPLYLAFELAQREWKLAFTTGLGQRPWHRTIPARALERLDGELAAAKQRFGLAPTAPVVSCYEAGREGFWLHRALTARGVANGIVDAASIEVNRRARRAKADRLDNEKLVEMLVRAHAGERRVWKVVHVPSVADEDRRHLDRERATLVAERTRLRNRIHAALATQGLALRLQGNMAAVFARLRLWDGSVLPPGLRARLEREWARVAAVTAALATLERERHQAVRTRDAAGALTQRLAQLRAVGETTAWTCVTELFAWRQFQNRRQVGALLGLAPTPFQSGAAHRELGIAKSGNPRLRALAVELAWAWLRYQPASALSQWYQQRFATGGPRRRRIGIVALARKLMIALWRYCEFHELPEGALLKA